MNKEISALLTKEIIKLRLPCAIALLVVCFAAYDTYLNLKGLYDSYGAYSLTLTLISKQLIFFKNFEFLLLASAFFAFAQFWPEVKNTRLRLLFNMPIAPEKIISIILAAGILSISLIWGLSLFTLFMIMTAFALPEELIIAVMHAALIWWFLSLSSYLLVAAFISALSLYLRIAVIIVGLFVYHLFVIRGYLEHLNNYAVLALLILAMLAMVFFVLLDYKRETYKERSYGITQAITFILICSACLFKLPEVLNDSLDKGFSRHSFYYSLTRNEFVTRTTYPETFSQINGRKVLYQTASGETLTKKEYKKSLPLFYHQDLIKWGELPEIIQDIAIKPYKVSSMWSRQRFSPKAWNKHSLNLHVLLESAPKGAKFYLPDDLLRVRDNGAALDFYLPSKGHSDTLKGELFMSAMKASGFEFPIRALSNNSDTRHKKYDNGFIIADSKNQLFQLKMLNGEPQSLNLNIKVPGNIRAVQINEDRLRKTFAYVVTEHALYAVSNTEFTLNKIPIEHFNADQSYVELFQDAWGWSVNVTNLHTPSYSSVTEGKRFTTDLKPLDQYTYTGDPQEKLYLKNKADIMAFVFPWQIQKRMITEDFSRIIFVLSSKAWVIYLGLLTPLLLLFIIRNKMKKPLTIFDYILTATFGFVALLTVVLLNRRDHLNIRY
ncbi:MAG: DUF4857 domain-containing protein [Colwellia sp.]